MSLNMHGTQFVLSQHKIIIIKKKQKKKKTLKFYWLCSKTSKCNVKWASSRYIVLP